MSYLVGIHRKNRTSISGFVDQYILRYTIWISQDSVYKYKPNLYMLIAATAFVCLLFSYYETVHESRLAKLVVRIERFELSNNRF